MTSEAAQARSNSMAIDAKKDSAKQVQSGDWKVTFTIAGNDMPEAVLMAMPGTHYKLAMVEVADDGESQPPGTAVKNRKPGPKYEYGTVAWAKQQGHILAADHDTWPHIRAFNKANEGIGNQVQICYQAGAAALIRSICHVESMADFKDNTQQLEIFKNLHRYVMVQTGRWTEER